MSTVSSRYDWLHNRKEVISAIDDRYWLISSVVIVQFWRQPEICVKISRLISVSAANGLSMMIPLSDLDSVKQYENFAVWRNTPLYMECRELNTIQSVLQCFLNHCLLREYLCAADVLDFYYVLIRSLVQVKFFLDIQYDINPRPWKLME